MEKGKEGVNNGGKWTKGSPPPHPLWLLRHLGVVKEDNKGYPLFKAFLKRAVSLLLSSSSHLTSVGVFVFSDRGGGGEIELRSKKRVLL